MSLLLDALQRASKDKERAAAGGVVPTPSLELKDTAPGTAYPDLQESTLLAVAPVSAPLELSLETHGATPSPVSEPAVKPTAPAPAWEMTELTTLPEPVVQIEIAPVPVAKTTLNPVELRMAAPEQPQGTQTSASSAKGPAPAKVAQEIRRAYVPDGKAFKEKPARNRRVMILGGLAVVLALGLGSVLLGLWGDPMAWLGGGSSLAPASGSATPIASVVAVPVQATAEPATVASEAPAPAMAASGIAPAAVAKPAASGSIKQMAAGLGASGSAVGAKTEPSKPVRKPSGNEVAVGDGTGNFIAKTRGANALETGYAALLEGRLDMASRAYTQALNDNPEERDALLGLAYIAHKRGQREQAQDYYRRVLRQEPGNATAAAAMMALDNEGDSGVTASRARELAQQQPDSVAAVALAANALARDGQVAEAVQYFARAQALEPGSAMHAYNHGVALDRMGKYAAARQQYERALQLADRGTNPGTRTFSVEGVRQRVEQLRQAAQPRTDGDK